MCRFRHHLVSRNAQTHHRSITGAGGIYFRFADHCSRADGNAWCSDCRLISLIEWDGVTYYFADVSRRDVTGHVERQPAYHDRRRRNSRVWRPRRNHEWHRFPVSDDDVVRKLLPVASDGARFRREPPIAANCHHEVDAAVRDRRGGVSGGRGGCRVDGGVRRSPRRDADHRPLGLVVASGVLVQPGPSPVHGRRPGRGGDKWRRRRRLHLPTARHRKRKCIGRRVRDDVRRRVCSASSWRQSRVDVEIYDQSRGE